MLGPVFLHAVLCEPAYLSFFPCVSLWQYVHVCVCLCMSVYECVFVRCPSVIEGVRVRDWVSLSLSVYFHSNDELVESL